MPDLDGLELARVLRRFATPPQLVFVTAYESAAVDAFELHALDCLLKPVGRGRLQEAALSLRDLRPTNRRSSSANPPAGSAARILSSSKPLDGRRSTGSSGAYGAGALTPSFSIRACALATNGTTIVHSVSCASARMVQTGAGKKTGRRSATRAIRVVRRRSGYRGPAGFDGFVQVRAAARPLRSGQQGVAEAG